MTDPRFSGQCIVCGSSAVDINSHGVPVCRFCVAICGPHRQDPCPICDSPEEGD